MYKGKTTLGIITARGGSKGIPRKNIRELCGKPLIAYTTDAAKQSKYLTRCIVSTEDDEIASIAKELGAEVPCPRPRELAHDTSTTIEVLQHVLLWLEKNEEERYDYVMVLQPTSPLRTAEDIDACIKKIVDTNADSVMSMVQLQDMSLAKLKKIENDRILPLLEEEDSAPTPRHKIGAIYKRNTAIYLTKKDLIKQGDMFGAVSRPYVMPPERSIDINDPIDWALAEFFIHRSTTIRHA